MRQIRYGLLAFLLSGGCVADVGSTGLAVAGDSDGDGDPDGSDCAPSDPAIHAGAPEICNHVDDNCDGTVDEPVGTVYCVGSEPRPGITEQCLDNVLVGRLALASNHCPVPGGGWDVRDLFTHGFETMAGRYCVYEHTTHNPGPGGLPPSDDGRAPMDWLQPDCPVMVGLGGSDSELASAAVWEEYYEGWLAQLEAESSLPSVVSAVDGPLPRTTHVAVLDTAPPNTGFTSPAPSGRGSASSHGAVMGHLIEALACPGGSGAVCNTEFTNHVALERLPDGSDERAEGGVIGTFSQVAAAIEEAVTVGSSARGGAPRILALSIGAEPGYEVLSDGSPRPSADALRRALDAAVCGYQALVFASAGNATGGPGASAGPMLPGAWASDVASCGEPLLYAVGAVDPSDQPLQLGRVGGMPELVAPGRSVAFDLDGAGPGNPTPLMTGTSFGPVAAAAAAAILWSYTPHWTASDVADHLYASAVPLSHLGAADFCAPGGSCGTVARISMCGALLEAAAEVCTRDPGATICGVTCTATRIGPGAGSPVVLSPGAIASLPPGGPNFSAASLVDAVSSPTCGAGTIMSDMSAIGPHPDLCPFEQYPSREAGPLGPQPPTGGCRVCALDPSSLTAVIFTNEESAHGTFYPPVLYTSSGDVVDLSSVLPSPLAYGTKYVIEDLPIDSGAEAAALSFIVTDGGDKWSTIEEIEIW